MPDSDMGFLDPGGNRGGYNKRDIRIFKQFPSASAGKADGLKPQLFGFFHCQKDIPGLSAGGDADSDISGIPQGLYLPGKYGFISVVIA